MSINAQGFIAYMPINMDKETVEKAVEKGISLRGTARILHTSQNKLQTWLWKNGLDIEKTARLVPIVPTGGKDGEKSGGEGAGS